jgi:hypothetical protein
MPPNQGFRVGKVDCDSEKALRARFGIRSYPSFFVVDGWSVYEFDKPRTEVALMDFLRGGYKKQEVRGWPRWDEDALHDRNPRFPTISFHPSFICGMLWHVSADIILYISYGANGIIAGFFDLRWIPDYEHFRIDPGLGSSTSGGWHRSEFHRSGGGHD